jgi:phosphoribosylamine--glycine ligase
VLKISGGYDTFVGQLDDGRDVLAFLEGLSDADAGRVVLMAHVDGVEMGVGAYFNGERFLLPACLDWEHKRFFPGDLGELTGEMGTVVTYDRTRRFHELTLGRMEPLLRQHGYCGYINLNTIVNQDGIWPLEFTCRFGYPGYAILDSIQETSWANLFRAMVTRTDDRFATRPGFAVGIVMSTPPFPYSRADVKVPVGLPVVLDGLSEDDRRHLHYGEVGLRNGALVTSGAYGWTMVVTGVARTIMQAREAANRRAGRIVIPNVRYRRDIGDRLIAGDFARVEALGLLDAPDGRDTSPATLTGPVRNGLFQTPNAHETFSGPGRRPRDGHSLDADGAL